MMYKGKFYIRHEKQRLEVAEAESNATDPFVALGEFRLKREAIKPILAQAMGIKRSRDVIIEILVLDVDDQQCLFPEDEMKRLSRLRTPVVRETQGQTLRDLFGR